MQSRQRSVIKAEAGGGEGCPLLTEERQCGTAPCEKDCEVSQWSIFGQCSADCGGGTRGRTRSILQQPVAGGTACGELSEQQACNTEACVPLGVPAPVCVISDWSQWGACSKECGGGQAKRLRTLTEGTPADCGEIEESRECNSQGCKVDCAVSDWSQWNQCSKTCGGGDQERKRAVSTESLHDGAACPALSETRVCATETCPIVCTLSAW